MPGRPATLQAPSNTAAPILSITDATLTYGARTVWRGLNLAAQPGEFIAVLGANGSGKSSLLQVVLGSQPLETGAVTLCSKPVGRGSRAIGYIPQRIAIDPATPILARDLVRLGVDGHRWGIGLASARATRRKADHLLAEVGAAHLASAPVGQLSGGELQRVRIAEALAAEPTLLLADEPLAALDVAQARHVVDVIDRYRARSGAAVLFVTHDINSVLSVADRVLYFGGRSYKLGTPDEVLNSATLTDLYGAPVDVFKANGRIVVVAATDPGADREEAHDHPHRGGEVGCEDPHGHQHLYAPDGGI